MFLKPLIGSFRNLSHTCVLHGFDCFQQPKSFSPAKDWWLNRTPAGNKRLLESAQSCFGGRDRPSLSASAHRTRGDHCVTPPCAGLFGRRLAGRVPVPVRVGVPVHGVPRGQLPAAVQPLGGHVVVETGPSAWAGRPASSTTGRGLPVSRLCQAHRFSTRMSTSVAPGIRAAWRPRHQLAAARGWSGPFGPFRRSTRSSFWLIPRPRAGTMRGAGGRATSRRRPT